MEINHGGRKAANGKVPIAPRCLHNGFGEALRFTGSAEVVQALDTAIAQGKQNAEIVIVLSPVVQIPIELERQFVVVEHELPGRDQLEQIAKGIAVEDGELPEGDDLGLVLDAASGLTRMEAENAFSLSLVRHGKLAPESLVGIQDGCA